MSLDIWWQNFRIDLAKLLTIWRFFERSIFILIVFKKSKCTLLKYSGWQTEMQIWYLCNGCSYPPTQCNQSFYHFGAELQTGIEFTKFMLFKSFYFKKNGNQFNLQHGYFIKRIDLMCPWCFWLHNALDYTRFTCTWFSLTNISKSHVSLMFGPKQYPMADFQSPLHHTAPVTDGTSSISYVFHKYPKLLGWNPIQFTSPSLR